MTLCLEWFVDKHVCYDYNSIIIQTEFSYLISVSLVAFSCLCNMLWAISDWNSSKISCCLVVFCKLYNIFFRSGKVPPFPHSLPQSTAQAAKIRKWSTFSNSFQRNQHTWAYIRGKLKGQDVNVKLFFNQSFQLHISFHFPGLQRRCNAFLIVALEVIIILFALLSITMSGAQISVSNGTGQWNFSGQRDNGTISKSVHEMGRGTQRDNHYFFQ